MSKDIKVKDWGTEPIDLSEEQAVIEMKPVELHHKSNGEINDGASFLILMRHPSIPGSVVTQVSFNMLAEAMKELGYDLKMPESRTWAWWAGMEELPKYVKTNPSNLIGPQKVLRVIAKVYDNGKTLIQTDDPNIGTKGHLEIHYLLPATFEEYQKFMNAEAV